MRTSASNRNVISYLAGLELARGNSQQANIYLELIDKLQAKHDFGQTEYWFARAYALAGDYQEAMKYLKSSVANGYWNNCYHFQNDIVFQSVKDTKEFKEIRDYWKTQ